MNNDPMGATRRAVILIPGTLNYFYNQSGHRIAEALGELGFGSEVTTLEACPEGEFDLCVLSNISEVIHVTGEFEARMARIIEIGSRCRAMISLGIDCVSTPWYHRIRDYSARAGVDLIFDLGVFDQSRFLEPQGLDHYRFVFSGLTPSELRMLESLDEDDAERTIPWAFVGAMTPHRVALADHLIQRIGPGGFLYMPRVAAYLEKGSPHLNQQQFERVLGRTRYQFWCSHHSYFYMEPERFRTSLLTGGVPIKVVESRAQIPESVPLGYLMMEMAELGDRLTMRDFPHLRRRFREDWRRFPTLSQELAESLREVGFECAKSTARAA
jgi:hypothetical protein